jgi:2-polyprenyl-6-methoxyphenol hydroxylase-like FAD-dependent oxidoreductase
LKWRRPANQLGYWAMIHREPNDLETTVGQVHCENWNGSRRLLYAPCTAEHAYVQLTSLRGDGGGNAVPIDRDLWHELFPRHDWIIDRIPDQGRGDWFELLRPKDWSKGRVVLVGDAASAQPPFLGQGGGCAMMSGYALAQAIAHNREISAGIGEWKARERWFIEWVQHVAYWYGQLALLPPGLRTAAFRAIDRRERLKRATLLAAARHDPTAPGYWCGPSEVDLALVWPLVH